MTKSISLEDCVDRLHGVAIAMGRIAPMRDPIANAVALDLSAGHIHVLMGLGHEGSLHMGVLASRVGITLPACTRLVDRMKDDGLVLRERDPDDRRVVDVKLSAAGRRLFEEIDADMKGKLSVLLSLLESDDRQQFVAILEKLIDGISRTVAKDPATTETAP